MRSTSNCLWQFPLTAKVVSCRSTMSHTEKCLKVGISHLDMSRDMEVMVFDNIVPAYDRALDICHLAYLLRNHEFRFQQCGLLLAQ